MDRAPAAESIATPPWTIPGNLCAEVHETHTGLVVLIGDRAYKAKKAVRTDFLDFSSVQQRRHACEREIELNRRLAPDSYLGLGRLDPPLGDGEPVIVMRRYPDSLRLAELVRAGQPVEDRLAAIAEVLARFHAGARRSPKIDDEATVGALTARWRENLTELQRHTGTVISAAALLEVTRLAERFLAGRDELYAQRIAAGRVVDGHGDLLTQDIFCLPEGPALLDCLEFDDRLRSVDGIDDAAFLAMDLEYLGRQDLAEFFLDEYCRAANDSAPRSLRDLCIAYRAVVRAKVDCVRVDQGHAEAAADARRHLDIALAHLRAGAVQLVVIGGGPGTGKTTLAHALAQAGAARVVSTDEVRRDLQRSGAISGSAGELDAGLYTPENAAAVYDEVLRRAQALLSTGHPVIVDGTWRDPRQRERVRRVGAQTSSPVVEFVCTVPIEQAVHRITTRGHSASDATPHIAEVLNDADRGWPEAYAIDTSRPIDESVAEAYQRCRLAL
ncbi:AAA family ATPase [Mycobacterium sp. Y57]|uniref:bifunctional aminoglycoside phosphotransferase/ATP-binding protein n=1 Tax=Mycolicibacterium xanthum TaxID=2796469 RepID=UPI001C85F5B2|nr:AAA family ATPase [Mycolicibacterium xanthum]MBX7433672.1 AAA family ATPase [Mycolicibacterium xanthum]